MPYQILGPITEIEMKQLTPMPKFVLCVRTEDDADVTPRKVYQVLPDRKASAEGFWRVVDDSGEDYLYPSELFVPINLPNLAKRHFRREAVTTLHAA